MSTVAAYDITLWKVLYVSAETILPAKVNFWLTFVANILVLGPVYIFSFYQDVHVVEIEPVNISRKVHDVEFILLINLKISHFKHEPVCISLCVCVYFHE